MKDQENLLHNVGETVEYAHQYLQKEMTLLKLDVAEKAAKSSSSIITLAVIGFLVGMVLIMFSISAGFWLGKVMNSYAQAFLIITIGYTVLAFIVYFFQKRLITNPVLKIVLKSFFE